MSSPLLPFYTPQRFLAACLILFLAPAMTWSADDHQDTSRRLKDIQSRIHQLSTQLGSVRGKADTLQRDLRVSERAIGKVATQLHELDVQQKEQQRRLQGLDDEKQALERLIEDHHAALEIQVQAAYAMGREAKLKLLLSQEDPGAVARTVVYYDYLNRARAQHLKAVNLALHDQVKIEARIRWETQRLSGLKIETQKKHQRLSKERGARRQLLVRLRDQIKAQGGRLAGLEKDRTHLQALLHALDEVLADIPDDAGQNLVMAKRKGKLGWPVKGRRLSVFGKARGNGGPVWRGVLLAAKQGSKVKAVHQGRVAYADWLRGMGLLIIVDHGDGYMSLYGHNESLYREVGEWVEAGDLVARVGDSGGQSQPALYFELRASGKPVDPVAWCRRDGKPVS